MKLKSKRLFGAAAAAAVVSATAAAAVFAASSEEVNDASEVLQARVSLSQAVAAAEQQQQGRASRAEYEQDQVGHRVYEVEVVTATRTFDVTVDAETGKVLGATEDAGDRNNERHDGR
jgi:uncharacterized membrane protein YkoI